MDIADICFAIDPTPMAELYGSNGVVIQPMIGLCQYQCEEESSTSAHKPQNEHQLENWNIAHTSVNPCYGHF